MATEAGPLFPFSTEVTRIPGSLVNPRWRRWLLDLRNAVDLSQIVIPVPPQLDQSDSLPTTPMDGGNLPAGLYSVRWYLRRITNDGVSSSATVTIGWVDQTPQTYTATAMVEPGSALQVDQQITIYATAGTPITYSVAYVSNTANQMHYDFRPVLQSVEAE